MSFTLEDGEDGARSQPHFPADNTPIHVVCCFDQKFELPFIVLAKSIERHAIGKVIIHALHDGPLHHAPKLATPSTNVFIHYKDISGIYQKLATLGPQSSVTYARLDLPTILPELERVIYIDVDTLVLRDLTELFSIDLGASALAAVTDHVLVGILPHSAQLFGPEGNRWKVDEYLTKAVGISCWQRYFNAGLLVMDLKRMRATGVIDRAREFLQRSRGRAINNDQDALNYAVDGKFLELDPRWNCIANYADPSFFETAQGRLQEVGTLWQTPWMLHYAGLKPWNNLAPQAQSTELFWAEALRTKAAWLIIRLFLATIPGLRWIGVSQALWELRNRGPRLNFVQVGWYWILNVTRHFL